MMTFIYSWPLGNCLLIWASCLVWRLGQAASCGGPPSLRTHSGLRLRLGDTERERETSRGKSEGNSQSIYNQFNMVYGLPLISICSNLAMD